MSQLVNCYESGDHSQSVIGYFMSTLARPGNFSCQHEKVSDRV